MNVNTYNVLISSKNKSKSSDTNAELSVKLDEPYFNQVSEEMYVCMNQFHTIKSFYACQPGLNNHFQVIYRIPGFSENIETFDIYLSEGNYDVNTLKKEIQVQTNNALFDISYVPRLNKYLYKKIFVQNPEAQQFNVFILPKTAGVFLGFENGVEYEILAEGIHSAKFINLSGYTSMVIKIEGDLNIENSISNIEENNFKYDKILAVLNINDKAPMDSITFENDGCLFKHKIVGGNINTFKIKIVNESGRQFTNMADWIMSLRFEKVVRDNQFSMMERLLARINFFIGAMFLYFDIPIPITLDDMYRLQ